MLAVLETEWRFYYWKRRKLDRLCTVRMSAFSKHNDRSTSIAFILCPCCTGPINDRREKRSNSCNFLRLTACGANGTKQWWNDIVFVASSWKRVDLVILVTPIQKLVKYCRNALPMHRISDAHFLQIPADSVCAVGNACRHTHTQTHTHWQLLEKSMTQKAKGHIICRFLAKSHTLASHTSLCQSHIPNTT